MIRGVPVTVVRKVPSGLDRFNNVIYTDSEPETVENVLVHIVSSGANGSTEFLEASRPEGVTTEYTLHFPKTYTKSLEGCRVFLPEPWAEEGGFLVVGNPQPYIDANTPTKWNRPVQVMRANG